MTMKEARCDPHTRVPHLFSFRGEIKGVRRNSAAVQEGARPVALAGAEEGRDDAVQGAQFLLGAPAR
jgi:hypothetical protein